MNQKRYMVLLVLLFILSNGILANAFEVSYEELPVETEPLLPKYEFDKESVYYRAGMGKGGYLMEFRGDSYCTGRADTQFVSATILPIKLSGEHPSSPDCIWTGEYYFTRPSELDGYWYNAWKYAMPIRLIDEQGNIVKELNLKPYGAHAKQIAYLNGVYYCRLTDNGEKRVLWSTDFENWEETTMDIPQQIGNVRIVGDKTALPHADFMNIIYEDHERRSLYYTLGDWLVERDEAGNYYFTNDHVYFVKIPYPQELMETDKKNLLGYVAACIYENGEDIVIDSTSKLRYRDGSLSSMGIDDKFIRLRVKKAPVYERLDEMKDAPYVAYQGTLLGFETPPVMEDDRTLVPMRFLFEQLGAEVDWNQETMTATATLGTQAVAFSIDNIGATVNSAPVTMDVPARLVNDKTMVPLRFLSENLGYTVTWDGENRIATIE